MKDLSAFLVGPTDSIRTAMQRIDANKHRVVVVVDEARRVLGTVSDGDVRRAMLKDMLAMAPVEQIMNMNCRTTRERDPARLVQILRKEHVTVLPVVTDENVLVDIVLATEPFLDEPGGSPS